MAAMAAVACSTCGQPREPAATTTGTASTSRAVHPGSLPTPATATTFASYARTQPGPTAPNPGSISGLVNCACGGLPGQDVYAISTDGARFYVTQTVPGQAQWKILGVQAGEYFVYAAERFTIVPGSTYVTPRKFASGYTKAIACGLTVYCTDDSPIPVHVTSGADSAGIETFDWYAPDFPLVPVAGPPEPTLGPLPPSFPTAEQAVVYQGVNTTAAQHVAEPAQCPVNLACFWLISSRAGNGASYFIASAGANGMYTSCGLYLIGGGSAWQTFDAECRQGAAVPAVGASLVVSLGMGETGCVNVHDSPSLSGRVVACLQAGTAVQIDDGPTYTPNGSGDAATQYWWHLAGKGWMVHRYLGAS
jgi:hypothetical protein